nr:MAG TPA_asm: hypothetical protein [Caudoviricetes sp.]
MLCSCILILSLIHIISFYLSFFFILLSSLFLYI